jgi:hypothetical protein
MNKARLANLLTILPLLPCLLTVCCIITGPIVGERIWGSGNVITETRAVSGVSGVNLSTIGHLIIEVSDTESLHIEAEDNLMDYIETDVRNGELTIRTRNKVNLKSTKPVYYHLTVTGLDTVMTYSSGNIEAPDLKAGRFSITVASSGSIQIASLEADTLTAKLFSSGNLTIGRLNARTLNSEISSAGNLYIGGGEVKTQNVALNSSGNYTAGDLASNKAEMKLNSAGSATIRVIDSLKATLNSSGDLSYLVNPTLDATTRSSGKIIQVGQYN